MEFQHKLTNLVFLAVWDNNVDQSVLFYHVMLMICHFLACFPGDMWAIMSQSWSWVRTKLGFLSHVYAGNICQSWQKRLSWKKLERNFLFDIFSCIWSLFHGKTFPIYVLNLKLQKTFKDSARATRFRYHMIMYMINYHIIHWLLFVNSRLFFCVLMRTPKPGHFF